MVVLNSKVIIGVTATEICISQPQRSSLSLYNNDPNNIIYIGADVGVTVSNGFPIPAKTAASFMRGLGDTPNLQLFGIAELADNDLRVFEQYGAFVDVSELVGA